MDLAEISVANARLPQTYEAAKQALSQCSKIDECQSWADKAEALASYAKQADDDSLRRLADRIQARAIRRAGELLKQFDGRGRPSENNNGSVVISQKQAAADAGMSQRQKETAVRVANVPEEEFNAAVEGDDPPTVTQLAEQGKKTRPVPEGFKEATHMYGAMERYARLCEATPAEVVASGLLESEREKVLQLVSIIDAWNDILAVNLTGDKE